MKSLKAAALAVYSSPSVRTHVFDLVKVIVGVLLAHYGVKAA